MTNWTGIKARLTRISPEIQSQLADTAVIGFRVLPKGFARKKVMRKPGVQEYLYYRHPKPDGGVEDRYIGKVEDVLEYLSRSRNSGDSNDPRQLELSKIM